MIAIVDYGVGNLFSLVSSFRAIGAEAKLTSDRKEIEQADKIVLPGVGAFEDAAKKLFASGLAEVVVAQAKQGKPILGICRGLQSLNVALGGSLYQDINTQFPVTAEHRMQEPVNVVGHGVTVLPNTPLAQIAGCESYMVNSYHHQAVKKLGKGLEIMAYSQDGLIEGAYMPDRKFVLGVQWHPERISEVDEQAQRLFAAFVDACRE